MTDNEKAATFIGWKPGERCNTEGIAWLDCPHKQFKYHYDGGDTLGVCVEIEPHDIPAPDMTDPGNYMKALEKIDPLKWKWNLARDYCIIDDWEGNLEFEGRTPVEALAALYDVEHPA